MSQISPCLLAYVSLSQVHRVKRHLYRDGVFVDMVRTPRSLGLRGCGFALRCDAALVPAIRHASEELAIEIRGEFVESPSGYIPLP